MLKHVLAIAWTSVRLSVRHTLVYCIKTAERIVMLSSPHDSPSAVVLTTADHGQLTAAVSL